MTLESVEFGELRSCVVVVGAPFARTLILVCMNMLHGIVDALPISLPLTLKANWCFSCSLVWHVKTFWSLCNLSKLGFGFGWCLEIQCYFVKHAKVEL